LAVKLVFEKVRRLAWGSHLIISLSMLSGPLQDDAMQLIDTIGQSSRTWLQYVSRLDFK